MEHNAPLDDLPHFGSSVHDVSQELSMMLRVSEGKGKGTRKAYSQLKGFPSNRCIESVLRSYSNRFGSKGLQPQLVCCAPFPSIAPYFRILYLSYLKIRMAIIAYPKVWTIIIWYPDVETSIIFLSKDKE
jgi:hypothetical protein